jgi:phosphatidylglycerophosphatase A
MFPFWFTLLGVLLRGEMDLFVSFRADPFVYAQCWLTGGIALTGLWSAHRAARYWNIKDPQKVVIDEVSGQHLALLLGGFWPRYATAANNPWSNLHAEHPIQWATHPLGANMWISPNWKYLLLGFILFRVFDIWKPFPARQAESLPGGLGIMADDWIAGIYAALGLWAARAVGL